jgi:DNA gyrase inhibitor GyrI
MSETDKLLAFRDLCASVDSLARVGILLDHPEATEAEVLRHLARRRFGSELAEAAFGPG